MATTLFIVDPRSGAVNPRVEELLTTGTATLLQRYSRNGELEALQQAGPGVPEVEFHRHQGQITQDQQAKSNAERTERPE